MNREHIWIRFKKKPFAMGALGLLILFFLIGLYAPLFASSKPLLVKWKGHLYFPLLRYLFYPGFYSKPIDLFYNLFMFTFPILLFELFVLRHKVRKIAIAITLCIHCALFIWIAWGGAIKDPARSKEYIQLNALLRHQQRFKQHTHLEKYRLLFEQKMGQEMPTLWAVDQRNARSLGTEEKIEQQHRESLELKVLIAPFIRPFHWEDDAGGSQLANPILPWWELTRVNRKDLVASLLFGIRVSLVVGLASVALSLIIGIPLGLIAGYGGGKIDLIICRFIEIWEAMPIFFMLLLIVSITQSKSIFLVITTLGLFGWTQAARFVRAETLKHRNLPYILASQSLGFPTHKVLFSHLMPNVVAPVLTLLPFSIMAAISSEAGLSFLGLGEEGSSSWGVLMDEGRSVFPSESYLLWPPAVFLTLLLISIALVGDGLRDAMDPKSQN